MTPETNLSMETQDALPRQRLDAGPLADLEERRALFAVLDSYRQYRRQTHYSATHRRRQNFYALPKSQQQILLSPPFTLLETLNEVDDAIDTNADIADAILKLALSVFELPEEPERGSELDWHSKCRPGDLTKAHSTIRQFWRDWSTPGFSAEVKPILDLILADLAGTIPLPSASAECLSIPTLLLPGAGLGRLLLELCLAGYNAEGNEMSYHQLLASNFVLNSLNHADQYKLYPFVTNFTNLVSRASQLAYVTVPDIHPGSAMRERMQAGGTIPGEMNMSAGDFITSYSSKESKDTFTGIITVYFIDTAPNLIRYIETVRNCLVEGGIWINIGPLLWHFDDRVSTKLESIAGDDGDGNPRHESNAQIRNITADDTGIGEPGSFELSEEEVILLVEQMGFEIVKHEILPTGLGGYIQDPTSMMQSRYRCSHWVARKLHRQ